MYLQWCEPRLITFWGLPPSAILSIRYMYICTIFFFKLTWNSFKKQRCAALLPYIKSYFTTSTYCSGINFAYILLYIDCCIVTFWKKSSGIWKWAWCRLEMAIRGNLTYTFFPVGWSIQLIWQNWWTCPSHTHSYNGVTVSPLIQIFIFSFQWSGPIMENC